MPVWIEEVDGPEPLSEAWYKRLKEKLAKAPGGYWRFTSDSFKSMIYLYQSEGCEVLAEIENKDSLAPNERGMATADLLVEARNALPALIEENERLRDGLRRLAVSLGLPPSEANPDQLLRHLEQLKHEFSDSLADEPPHRNGVNGVNGVQG